MTEIDKTKISTKLLWVDLEMTGLDPQKDVILEVAAEVTDFSFKTLASFEALIKHPQSLLSASNPWAYDQHTKSGLFERIQTEGRPESEVQAELVHFIDDNFSGESAVLAGNSIHNDRLFIRRWWPDVEALLHYRMLDVSSWKLVMQGKFGVDYDKKDTHRAFDDIQASIAELQYYLEELKRD